MGKSKSYTQKYVKDWEKEVEFRDWLKPVAGDDGICVFGVTRAAISVT